MVRPMSCGSWVGVALADIPTGMVGLPGLVGGGEFQRALFQVRNLEKKEWGPRGQT